ncbi:DUF418 domain-containing protein [Streptomyces niveiscabiei]|uniref:DUF418 domain-containing protein n=1 Tax=Streptomyces niveiscabiei TaxID=164115 RepID=UPI0029B4BB67|nr:DUF418 domain-containing protein [Streptomyces niveiscabiei]MDX3386080.1 DUF418 domain-containing protein [Streptomyces niveiscabiei]
MAIQFDSAMRRGHRWPWRYEWRSLLLLADFDILMGYALTAMVVAPLPKLRTRWLVLAAGVAGGFHLSMQLREFSTLAVGGLGVGMPLMLWAYVGLPGATHLDSLSRYTIAPVVASGYLGLVLLRRGGGRGFLARRVAGVGRTALSCCMLQNVLAMVAFSAWGLRFGPLGAVGTVVAWAVISGILMLAASLWLRRFSQGPFELVWKAAVDAPFRKRAAGVPARQRVDAS